MSLFDELLTQADGSAQTAHWQQAYELLSRASALEPQHAGVITGLGTCLIQLNQPAQAVPFFQHVTELEPGSPDAHNNLAVAHMLAGQFSAAEAACRQALLQSSDHLPAWRNLALACLRQGRVQEGVSTLAAVVQAYPNDTEALLLLASCYAQAGQAESARFIYRRVLANQPDQADALAGLTALEPKPAAHAPNLNRLARPEHASKLARLAALAPAPARRPASAEPETPAAEAGPEALSVAFFAPNDSSAGVRVSVPASGLRRRGHRITAGAPTPVDPGEGGGIYVFARPQLLATDVLKLMDLSRHAGAHIVVDLDEDFQHTPPDHPGYKQVGPGNPANLRLLENAIAQADLLVVPTAVLAERYGAYARQVTILPNGWSQANPLWDKPAARHKTLNIGWAGTPTHRSDFAMIRPALIRFMRETPEAQLVIGGDPAIYESLSALPESRRLFLPMVTFEDYPYLLSYFDILLAPLRDNPFNQAKSDLKLVEAGVRRIPWVASPRPAYQAWGVGGLLAEEPDDWYAALRQLAADPARRRSLGAAGRTQAETRESRQLAPAWEAVLAQLAAAPQATA